MNDHVLKNDADHVWHPYTPAGPGPEPLAIAAARGAWLTLEDGRRLFDASSSWWAILHGHGRPELIAALEKQARTLDHVIFAGCTHAPAATLAAELARRLPGALDRVFYSDNGSTAVEVALKMVRHAWVNRGEPRRQKFVGLRGGYHGDTVGAMSVGERSPFFDAYAPMLFDADLFSDIDELERLLEEDDGRVAGVIVEPMLQGAAGMVMYPPEFLRAIRERCDAHGVYLIADEVLTGFGRTGRLFACEHADVVPDLICLAKGLTGGMIPFGATVATSDLWDVFAESESSRTLYHGHTFAGYAMGCAVALANLEIIDSEDTPARLASIGRRMTDVLAPLANRDDVLDVRSIGGVVAVEIASSEAGYHDPIGQRLKPRFIERGALIRPLGNVFYLMPPACTTDDEAQQVAETLRDELLTALDGD